MIGKSLLDAFQPGASVRRDPPVQTRRIRGGTPSASAEDAAKDSLELTSPESRGGFQASAFRFRHMAILREVAALHSSTPAPNPGVRQAGGADSASVAKLQEERQTELDLFYTRTQTIALGLDSQTADHLQSTSQGVGRAFEVTISLDASFLYQFSGQSESLTAADPALFDQYLTATDGMVGVSPDAARGFFDMVDQAMRDAQAEVMNGLDSILGDVGAALGLEGDALNNFKSQIAQQVAGFFSDLSQFVSQAHQTIGGLAQMLGSPSPTAIPEPALTAEAPKTTVV